MFDPDLDLLAVALAVEGALIACALGALVCLRLFLALRARAIEAGVARLEPLLHGWLVDGDDPRAIADLLRGESPHVAFRTVARLATAYLTFERQQTLAPLLRDEPWVRAVLRHGRSMFWWRRFDAARLLSIVGGASDASLVARLLADPSPAVRLVAIDAAARLGGQLIDLELDSLPSRQDAVQQYQFAALNRRPGAFVLALLPRLALTEPAVRLNAWIDAAGALADPVALRRVRELASHADANVRLHVARAMRRLSEPETEAVLLGLLADPEWRVRAQAARALGALRAHGATRALTQAVRDRSWWVRYRSALALAQIGGPARNALLDVSGGQDALARDMAVLVSDLTPAAVVEMSEV